MDHVIVNGERVNVVDNKLDLSAQDIVDITKIERLTILTNLSIIDLSHNQITKIKE